MAEPVPNERLPPLDEEEADSRREDPDDHANSEREAHELELEHQVVRVSGHGTGRATSPGRAAGVAVEHDAAHG